MSGSWAAAELDAKVNDLVSEWAAGHDMTLMASVYEEPRKTGTTTFEPGVLEGTLYLFRAFVCGAAIEGRSSEEVTGMRDFMDLSLMGDFSQVRARSAAADDAARRRGAARRGPRRGQAEEAPMKQALYTRARRR